MKFITHLLFSILIFSNLTLALDISNCKDLSDSIDSNSNHLYYKGESCEISKKSINSLVGITIEASEIKFVDSNFNDVSTDIILKDNSSIIFENNNIEDSFISIMTETAPVTFFRNDVVDSSIDITTSDANVDIVNNKLIQNKQNAIILLISQHNQIKSFDITDNVFTLNENNIVGIELNGKGVTKIDRNEFQIQKVNSVGVLSNSKNNISKNSFSIADDSICIAVSGNTNNIIENKFISGKKTSIAIDIKSSHSNMIKNNKLINDGLFLRSDASNMLLDSNTGGDLLLSNNDFNVTNSSHNIISGINSQITLENTDFKRENLVNSKINGVDSKVLSKSGTPTLKKLDIVTGKTEKELELIENLVNKLENKFDLQRALSEINMLTEGAELSKNKKIFEDFESIEIIIEPINYKSFSEVLVIEEIGGEIKSSNHPFEKVNEGLYSWKFIDVSEKIVLTYDLEDNRLTSNTYILAKASNQSSFWQKILVLVAVIFILGMLFLVLIRKHGKAKKSL